MRLTVNTNHLLGLIAIAVGLIAVIIWVPMDTGSGIAEKVRGKYRIGDAFAPTVAFGVLIFAGLLTLLETRHKHEAPQLRGTHFAFAVILLGLFALSLGLMRWAGPLAVSLLSAGSETSLSYRDLRDTAPYKYIGFMCGGATMVAAFISLSARTFKWRFLLVGAAATLAMIVVYDLPFEDLLLPPNGDV